MILEEIKLDQTNIYIKLLKENSLYQNSCNFISFSDFKSHLLLTDDTTFSNVMSHTTKECLCLDVNAIDLPSCIGIDEETITHSMS